MFRLDIKFDNLLIPTLEYEVYSSIKKLRLDLNYCSNEEIVILNPVKIKEDTLYKYLSNSNYYNDKCFNYTTDDETDIILNDRRKEYVEKNLSLCENNCKFDNYDYKTKNAKCVCKKKNLFYYILKYFLNLKN